MKAKEVMEKLRITRVTLGNYVKRGYIKAYQRLNTGRYDYDDEDVIKLAFYKKHKNNSKDSLVDQFYKVQLQMDRIKELIDKINNLQSQLDKLKTLIDDVE